MLRALRARSPAPAASMLVFDEYGRLLLVKRRFEPYAGYWSLPGGHIEPGEDSLSAAVREVAEETSVEPRVEGLAGIAEVRVDNLHGYLIIVYWGRGSGEPRASSDALEARWLEPNEARSLPLTPSTRAFLEHWEPGLLLHVIVSGVRVESLRWYRLTSLARHPK